MARKRVSRRNEGRNRVEGPRRRSIAEYGTGDDAGKWYRCFYCNSLCSVDREELGGAEAAHGSRPTKSFTSPTQAARPGVPGDPNSSRLVVKFLGQPKWVILKADADGEAATTTHEWTAAGVGCHFCFSRSWK